MAGAAAIVLDGINVNILIHKVEKLTGIEESAATLLENVQEFWPKYLTICLLLLLAATAILSLMSSRLMPRRQVGGTGEKPITSVTESDTQGHRELWDNQSN